MPLPKLKAPAATPWVARACNTSPAHNHGARMPLPLVHIAVIALIAITCAVRPAPARAETRVEVLATDPGATAVLHKGENFWLRIGYATDQPIQLRAEPYLAGKHVPAGNGGLLEVGPGTGESAYWFFFSEPRQIDTVVV